MINRMDNRRLPLLWRTVILLTTFVILSQLILYIWVQHSVKGHFEQMDAEIITHAAFNLRKRVTEADNRVTSQSLPKPQSLLNAQQQLNSKASSNLPPTTVIESDDHLHSSALDYDLKTVIADKEGRLLSSTPENFANELSPEFNLLVLQQNHDDRQFVVDIKDRRYRAIVIENDNMLALIALPIDVHHQYLIQFNHQLSIMLIAITLLLVSIAALSVYWGFAPLSTIIQKMKGINPEQLDERVVVSNMPQELRPLAESYNLMMEKLESNFESLSRYSDNIAHELRTPLATLSTQTQVMLNKPRDNSEYIEQLHHQHDTLEQLSSLINNMLLLAKTQKGLTDSQLHRVDTEKLIVKLIDYYEMIAEDRNISFEKVGDFHAVLGDESLLQRLFANLISNASYYAASNSVITIEASTVETSTHPYRVINDLQSIKPSASKYSFLPQSYLKVVLTNRLEQPLVQVEADKLFERFYRHSKTKNAHSGTGLGLSIVQAIARAHKGQVSITVKDEYYLQVNIELLLA
ncbi:ATP-binding protein [Psychrobacter sp. DM4]|uniref:ATP-binding protein n=1 Tax=Psychrobacter sp. DM4 TaxID=3440637 RepID=UPI003F4FE6BB